MILSITKEYRKELDPERFCIKAAMLNEQGPHLFIASTKWDEIRIELCEELPLERIRFLSMLGCPIKVKRIPDMTAYTDHLIVLYPSLGGALRRCKLSNGNPYEIVKECTYD